jgi:GWxTD domain-containing protein
MNVRHSSIAFLIGIFCACNIFSQTLESKKDSAGSAIKKLKKELKIDPGNSVLRRALAEKYLTVEDYGEIIDLYEKKFDRQECSDGEYKLYAAARIMNYEKMVITGKILSKLPVTSLFHSDLPDAEKALDRVLKKDSSDIEALFFKGVLRKTDGKNEEAEIIFRRIISEKPFFKSYIFDDAWLELGALLRKQERWKEANELLERRAMLDSSDTWPMIQHALSFIDLKKDDEATRMFYRGLTQIKEPDKIEQLFLEAQPIATKEELAAWKKNSTTKDQLQFLSRFWKSRDPNLVDAVNERLVEHYRRIVHARAYYKKIRPPYFDDRGFVYIRMGPPDKTFAGTIDESWVYESTDDHFDFVDVGQGAYEIRPLTDALRPGISPVERFGDLYEMLNARRNYHNDYDRLANKMKNAVESMSPERSSKQTMNVLANSVLRIEQELSSQSFSQSVKEKFDFNTGAEPLPINASFASFRSTNTSRLDFYYMIPVQKLKFMPIENVYDKSFLTVKARIFDTTYQEMNYLEREYRVTHIDSTSQLEYFIIDELRSLLKPGTYLLALDIRNNLNDKIGIYKITLNVRDYASDQLVVSDIELSSSVSHQVIIDKFIKPDTKLRVVPNPAGLSLKSKPLTIYYEIYNLTLDNDGRSSYEVSYAIESASGKNFFARLFSAKSRIVSTTVKTANSTTEREYIAFDISELPEGSAVLTVKVTDLLSKRSAVSKTELKIK